MKKLVTGNICRDFHDQVIPVTNADRDCANTFRVYGSVAKQSDTAASDASDIDLLIVSDHLTLAVVLSPDKYRVVEPELPHYKTSIKRYGWVSYVS